MPYETFQDHWNTFSRLINTMPKSHDTHLNALMERYVEQNLMILNDVLATSIDNLKQLQTAESANDIICTQARFTHDINKKLSLSAQRFLNASLGHIADYNDWLKAHCDFATD